MKISPRTATILIALAGIIVVFLAAFAVAQAAEVSSVRDSQYEWQCEDADGNLVSGHTRQDKAFQSCFNAALADGATYYVRGGSWRVSATGTTAPPPEPPPDPDPPPPDPAPTPQVTFGPLSTLTEFPANIGALKQDTFRWEVTFTLNDVSGRKGLASRDESGTLDPGHFSLWVENGVLTLRHQDACPNCGGSGESFKLLATTPIVAGEEYIAVASMSSTEGTSLWLDGVMEAHDPRSWGLRGNNLPLIVGGLCSSCKLSATPPIGPHNAIDGTVYMEIWDDALPLPQLSGHLTLRWELPTHYEPTEEQALAGLPGDPLEPGALREVALYRDGVRFVTLDPDTTSHEVTNLIVGQRYCFTGTVTTGNCCGEKESRHSDPACRTP